MRARHIAAALASIPTDHAADWRALRADYVRHDNAGHVGLASFDDQALADSDRAFWDKTEFMQREILRLASEGLPGLTLADIGEIYS